MLFKKIFSNIILVLKFIRRSYELRIKLLPIDGKLPFKGKISANGYYQYQLEQDIILSLLNLKKKRLDDKKRIFLCLSEQNALEKIFNFITPEIRSYLGADSFLDGINWMVTDSSKSHDILKQSNSISWHTDNVGSRLKLFLCIQGDGSQPTIVLPDKNRVPNYRRWLLNVLMESFRRFGIRNKINIYKSVAIKHYTGTANIFDTQLLHRGKYERSKVSRIVLVFEFSNPHKHAITRGPIGTKNNHNSFIFNKNLLQIKNFKSILDPNRMHKKGNIFLYSEDI